MNSLEFQVVDLRVESLGTPLGVDCPRPRLSWRVECPRRGAQQSAYRICVASSLEQLSTPDLWDTGRRLSNNTLDIPYEGEPLRSRQRLWWRVECWDENSQIAQCISSWEMGLLSASDWSADWIAIEAEVDRADRESETRWVWGQERRHDGTRKFRHTFKLVDAADVVIMTGGRDRLDHLWIDGQSQPVLRPADIDFVAPPLTETRLKLTAGSHSIAVEISFNPHLVFPSATGRFFSLARATYPDGRVERISTPGGWKTALDAPTGWMDPDFDDKNWTPVEILPEQPSVPWPARPAIHARREFSVASRLKHARLYVSALGAFEASLNGERIDDAILAPGYADVRAKVPYRVFDVGQWMKLGANTIGMLVGDGWFGSACAPMSRFPFVSAPKKLIAQLELLYQDGRCEVITTGRDWMLSESAILASEIYKGESYDARLDHKGWDRPGALQEGWYPAHLTPPPPSELGSDITPPVRVIELRDSQRVSDLGGGVSLYDFGQNHAGIPRLKISASSGTKVTMRFAELLKDGRIDQSNLRAAVATDTYICCGDEAGETYQPRFTFHGYRYAEVTCEPPVPCPDLKSCVIHSDLPLIGSFKANDPIVDGIWRNALWSQRSNFVGIPTDCPQRDERLGWTGDAMVFWDAATLNMDVESFTRRYLNEVRFAQQADGAFPVFAPTPWRAPEGIGPTPGWADAGVILPWMTWRRFGGTSIIDENWLAMTRYLQGIRSANPEMRWVRKRGADFGDWLSVDAKALGEATTPKDLIATALWAADCAMMVDMAVATGRDAEASAWRETRSEIVREFRQAYVASDGAVGNGSQTSYILALYFDLLTTDQRERAGELLAQAVRGRGTMLTTGFLGTPFALHVLADIGYADLAYDLLVRTEYPSWGYMLKQGATTMWERWNSDTGGVQMNSFNHYAFGAVSSFLMRRIAGIDSAEPGFRKILVRPLPNAGLGTVSGALLTAVGRIATHQKITGARYQLQLDVPANASAEVHLVGLQPMESGRAVEDCAHVRIVEQRPGATILEVGSGRFDFESLLR